jgi:hypothetical protein
MSLFDASANPGDLALSSGASTSGQSGVTVYILGAAFSADSLPVGFAVYSLATNGTLTVALSRSTVGVVNPGGGKYHQAVTLPAGFTNGYAVADDGSGNYATDSINLVPAPVTVAATLTDGPHITIQTQVN